MSDSPLLKNQQIENPVLIPATNKPHQKRWTPATIISFFSMHLIGHGCTYSRRKVGEQIHSCYRYCLALTGNWTTDRQGALFTATEEWPVNAKQQSILIPGTRLSISMPGMCHTCTCTNRFLENIFLHLIKRCLTTLLRTSCWMGLLVITTLYITQHPLIP